MNKHASRGPQFYEGKTMLSHFRLQRLLGTKSDDASVNVCVTDTLARCTCGRQEMLHSFSEPHIL